MMLDPKRKFGPNFKKLVIHRMSIEAIPAGSGLAAGIEFLSTPGRIAQGFSLAAEWCERAIEAIRSAAEPNPWKYSTEEEIAADLLRRVEERQHPKKA
jgi:hypothetical protein